MHRILIVDDEARVIQAFKESFDEDLDIEVLTALDGMEAIKLIQEMRIDLLVLDWRLMGELEGKDVLLFVKKNFPQICVLVVTASMQWEKEIRSLGADDCLFKPCKNLREKVKQELTAYN